MPPGRKNDGSTAVEFAILLPVWLMIFFAFLDYGWYLTNIFVLDHAVTAGARAGVKVKYWLEPDDDAYKDPGEIAKQMVRRSFWLGSIQDNDIEVKYINQDNEEVDETGEHFYLEVRVQKLAYSFLAGYLPEGMIPETIGAVALAAFP